MFVAGQIIKAKFYHPLKISLVIFLCWSILYFIFGEKITINSGCGYDGNFYCQITQHFGSFLQNQSFSKYYVHRILPCAIVHYALTFFGFELSLKNIISSFYVLNTLCWLFSIVLWHKIMQHFQISILIQWLMSILLWINFYVLKFIFYYPVLTDSMAFLAGLVLAYFYVQNKIKQVCIVAFLGSFVYPLFAIYTCILILFPIDIKAREHQNSKKKYTFLWITILIVSLFAGMRTYYAYRIKYEISAGFHLNTLVYMLTYGYVLYHLLRPLRSLNKIVDYIPKLNWQRVVLVVLILLTTVLIKSYLSRHAQMGSPSQNYFLRSIFGIGYHGATWIAQFFSGFGVIAVGLYIFLAKISQTVLQQSVGMYILFALAVLINLQLETRVIADIYVFIPLGLALTLQKYKWNINKKRLILIVLLLNLAISKVYLKIEGSKWFFHPVELAWVPQNYALSTYLMKDGHYWITLIVFAFISVVVFLAVKRAKNWAEV